VRVAYADPPYPGRAYMYKERQEVDHEELIAKLRTFDGWALSSSSSALRMLLPMCPERVRVMAWVKPFASWKPGVNPAYAWEPILVVPARKRGRELPTVRDWVSVNITLKKGLAGAKPREFCMWLFEALGMLPGDEFHDLFPGTGIVTKCHEQWANPPTQESLELRGSGHRDLEKNDG